MPRPKTNPDEILRLELRITPPDGVPITDWKIGDDFQLLLACQEGGDEDTRLHYHLYIETLRSRSWITKWVYSIAHCENGESGNAVFFSRKPHDNTVGYVIKHGNIAVRHGCSQTFIDEWITRSEQYKKDKDSAKQRAKRLKKSFTQALLGKIVETLKTDRSMRSPERVLDIILEEYHQANLVNPSKTIIENLIMSALYPYEHHLVRAFYLRNIEPR